MAVFLHLETGVGQSITAALSLCSFEMARNFK